MKHNGNKLLILVVLLILFNINNDNGISSDDMICVMKYY